MKIGIIGWGVEGQSVYKYFGPEHEYLIVNEHPRDDFPPETDNIKVQFLSYDKPPGITSNVADLNYLDGIEECEKIVYTPTSVKNLKKKYSNNGQFWDKATSALKLFYENSPSKKILGVTGSKGKGTTSSLIYEMLKEADLNTYLGGNIGRSVLDFVKEVGTDDWIVLELSSFQLYDFPYSPHIAVCLMITSEHMDWHSDMEEYVEAKSNIFRHQTPDDIAVYFQQNEFSARIAQLSLGTKIPYFEQPGAYINASGQIVIDNTEIINKYDVKLLGEHNLQNVCAAVTAVWQVHQNVYAIKKVLSTFSGLEHRLEFVRDLDGVKYYDDSFGTTPDTAIVALSAFIEPKIIILGGSDKSAKFDKLADTVVKNNVKHAIVIGQIANKVIDALRAKGFNNITSGLDTMPDIVDKARSIADSGDIVLLSTAAASFGLFKDYKDRGDQFKKAVESLS